MEIIVLSRKAAERFQPAPRTICISITDPDYPEAEVSEDFADVLRLWFDDVVPPFSYGDKVCDHNVIEEIISFVERNMYTADTIVVHCHAGASRSPAVALGLCDRFNWDASYLEKYYPGYNKFVRRLFTPPKKRRLPLIGVLFSFMNKESAD